MPHRQRHFSPICAFLFKARIWFAPIALITALAFITLVSASATHFHSTSQKSQECSICSVVADKIGSSFTAPASVTTHFFVLFAVAAITLRSSLHSCAKLLPPSCGPPDFD